MASRGRGFAACSPVFIPFSPEAFRGPMFKYPNHGDSRGVSFGGTFDNPDNSFTLDAGSYPNSVVAADLNGDGKVDLVCANGDDELRVTPTMAAAALRSLSR